MDVTRWCSRFRLLIVLTVLVPCVSSAALAKNNPSYTQFGHNIDIGPNEKTSDLTCFGCSIRIRGEVAGDVTAFAGSIVIEDQGQIAGDVTAFGGDLRIDRNVKIAGDTTVFAGQLRRDPQATISGDVTTMGGRGWLVPMLLTPFVVLGLLIAFVIWMIRLMRRPTAPAAAA